MKSEATPWLQPADRKGHGPARAHCLGLVVLCPSLNPSPTGSRNLLAANFETNVRMKINLDLIAKMVEAGASGGVILAYLREQEAAQAPRRAKENERKRAEYVRRNAEKVRRPAENVRQIATVEDTPRARLFREGTAALLSMGRTERAARQLIAGWLKLTHDDAQLVIATILKAQELAVADAAGWILATLRGKANGTAKRQSLSELAFDLGDQARERESAAGIGGPAAAFGSD